MRYALYTPDMDFVADFNTKRDAFRMARRLASASVITKGDKPIAYFRAWSMNRLWRRGPLRH